MKTLHGGQLVVNSLLREGVTHLFTLSGGHILPIYDACLDEGIRMIDTRHEQAAAHMAEGWSLASAEVGVCAVTAGPGLTDAVTAVCNAFQSNTPMLILGGRSPLKENDTGTLQDFDQMALMQPITKWARICHQTKRIPEYMSMAFRHALSGRPGPVYLELPMDVLYRSVEESKVNYPAHYRTNAKPAGDPASLKKAADLLKHAKKPLILAGSGCLWSNAGESLKAFAEKTKIPVMTRTAGRGVLPDSHDMALSGSLLETTPVIMSADTVLVLGSRFNFMLGFGKLFQPHVTVIQVDIEAEEIGFNRGANLGIVGDVKEVLDGLISLMDETPERQWVADAKKMIETSNDMRCKTYNLDAVPIHPLRLVREINAITGKEAAYVCDGGDIMLWGSDVFPAERPAAMLATGPLGCLGVGLPFAMAAKLAQPDRTVVLLNGDGTFGLNGMEFETAVRHNIPVICVIGNDQAWGMIKHGQEDRYGRERVCCSELGPVRYDRMVEALGGHGEYVEQPDDIKPAIIRAIESGKPACINVILDPTLGHPVSKIMAQGGIF